MPTYQYKCPACGHEFEEFQSIKDAPIETCPACGEKTRRIISGGAGLIFKGSGFYITDYRSDSYNKAAKKDSHSGADSSGSSGGSESKSSKAPAQTPPATKSNTGQVKPKKTTPSPKGGNS